MKAVRIAQWVATLAFLGGSGWFLYSTAAPLLTPPCTTPIEYTVGTIDPRFGVSSGDVEIALKKAAAVWNAAAGKTLVVAGTKDAIPVHLVYTQHQKDVELGETISDQQAGYGAAKAQVLALKADYNAAKAEFDRLSARYETNLTAYNAEVKRWNEKGGAPQEEYARLKEQAADLDAERKALNAKADDVNSFAGKINKAVASLNTLARQINSKVATYNKNAGQDFEQGHYVEDEDGKRIDIYEFTSQADLDRVLTHELGHALGMDHVENPDSIMYSFNVGDGLVPTDEDVAELRAVCRLDK